MTRHDRETRSGARQGLSLAIASALLALAGCQTASARDEPPTASPDVRFEEDMIVRMHMHENFGLLRGIEKLLIRGRLEDARSFARAIADAPQEPGLGPWTTETLVVRNRAASLAAATTVGEACHREARLAEACGDCHATAHVSPEFRPPTRIPADQPTIEARMARHVWATDRLWEGIVGGAADSWMQGLDILAATPLESPKIAGERVRYGQQLRRLADQARARRRTDTAADRARSYGDMLATCAGCHLVATPSTGELLLPK